ncbi:aluminum-activated malate transporter 8-like [Gastrolobium bilobum]|uniref:aluminum-activated malate transporter 8-like n=1 Tax=Gastrolobium bilobum TaxID=150636 RepID=UPI002AB09D78|nr:aluminum-activated malate transporter 8-like [Gastrolobium bilobum]
MESIKVISITNAELIIARTREKKALQSPIDSCLWKNKINCCSLVPIFSYFSDLHTKSDLRNIIHSVKAGIALVLVSLLFLVKPLHDRAGDDPVWAIMTVVVLFEFYAGGTLGKGFNRALGTLLGGGLGYSSAILAQYMGGIANFMIVGVSIFIFGSIATYFRTVPRIKKRYDYGCMIFIMTFSLVVVSGVRVADKNNVWNTAKQRLFTILVGLFIGICVSLFIFPLWASDELHHSTASRFLNLANTVQGCLEEYTKSNNKKESRPPAGFAACKAILTSKSKDELLANFAKWEPWHGKFGFSHPWEKYLKIGEVLRELAVYIIAVGSCLQASEQAMESLRQSKWVHIEPCEAVGSRIVWTLRELGDSMKQMRKCETEGSMLAKLKAARAELNLVISTSKISKLENDEVLAIANLVSLLLEVVEKVEELVKEVDELGDLAGFSTHIWTQI